MTLRAHSERYMAAAMDLNVFSPKFRYCNLIGCVMSLRQETMER